MSCTLLTNIQKPQNRDTLKKTFFLIICRILSSLNQFMRLHFTFTHKHIPFTCQLKTAITTRITFYSHITQYPSNYMTLIRSQTTIFLATLISEYLPFWVIKEYFQGLQITYLRAQPIFNNIKIKALNILHIYVPYVYRIYLKLKSYRATIWAKFCIF